MWAARFQKLCPSLQGRSLLFSLSSAQCTGIAVQRCCHVARPQTSFLLPQRRWTIHAVSIGHRAVKASSAALRYALVQVRADSPRTHDLQHDGRNSPQFRSLKSQVKICREQFSGKLNSDAVSFSTMAFAAAEKQSMGFSSMAFTH